MQRCRVRLLSGNISDILSFLLPCYSLPDFVDLKRTSVCDVHILKFHFVPFVITERQKVPEHMHNNDTSVVFAPKLGADWIG